jgi:predicted MFS family arabinose efflux permease
VNAAERRQGGSSLPIRLAVGWLTLFVIGTDLFILSPLLPSIAGEFAVSAAMAGLAISLFAFAYMVMAPLFGWLADRRGRRRVFAACLIGFAAANLLTAAAGGIAWLILSRLFAGAAAAGVTPLVYAGVGDAAPPARRGRFMAFAVSGLLLALAVGAPLGSLVGAAWGWRVPFVMLAAAGLALAAANRLVWPGTGAAAGLPALPPALGRPLAARLLPTALWATALYGMYSYLGIGLAAAGFSPAQIARAVGLYGLAALAGTLCGGHLADLAGTRRTMLASLAGLALSLAALGPALGAEWSADLVLILLSLLAQLFFPAQQAALARDFAARRASVLAWNNSALFLGISLGGLAGGAAVDRAGFAMGGLIDAAFAAVAIAATALAMARDGRAKVMLAITD